MQPKLQKVNTRISFKKGILALARNSLHEPFFILSVLVFLSVPGFTFAVSPVKWFLDMEAGTGGDQLTTSILNSATHGGTGSGWSLVPGPVGSMVSMQIYNGNEQPLYSPIVINGFIYNDSGSTRSIRSENDRDTHYIKYPLPTQPPKVSMGCYLRLENFTGYTYGFYDLIRLDGGGQYAILSFEDSNGLLYFRIHTQAGTGSSIPVSSGITYWVTILSDKNAGTAGVATLNVYNATTWQLVGTSTKDHTQRQNIVDVRLGRCDNHTDHEIQPGKYHYYDDVIVDEKGSEWPLMPGGIAFGSPSTYYLHYPLQEDNFVVQQVIATDVNLDGYADIVSGFNSPYSGVTVHFGNGDGTFATHPVESDPHGGVISLVSGNWNTDGKPDLAVVTPFNGGELKVLQGNLNGLYTVAATYAVGANPQFVAAGDFNTDGKDDLVTANKDGQNVTVLINSTSGAGTPSFYSAGNFSTGVGSAPLSVGVGDFNGDGKPDLAVPDGNSGVAILLNNVNPGFGSPTTYATGSGPSSVAIGDFNGDNYLDLAVANRLSATVTILQGNGNGTFTTLASYSVGTARSIVAGFYNQDTFLDLITTDEQSTTLKVLVGNGNASFQGAAPVSVGISTKTIASGLFSGDTRRDLVVANSTPGAGLKVLLNITLPNP